MFEESVCVSALMWCVVGSRDVLFSAFRHIARRWWPDFYAIYMRLSAFCNVFFCVYVVLVDGWFYSIFIFGWKTSHRILFSSSSVGVRRFRITYYALPECICIFLGRNNVVFVNENRVFVWLGDERYHQRSFMFEIIIIICILFAIFGHTPARFAPISQYTNIYTYNYW